MIYIFANVIYRLFKIKIIKFYKIQLFMSISKKGLKFGDDDDTPINPQ